MIGDATPLQIPGFDPSVLPAIPGLPGLTPPGNPPSGGGGAQPSALSAAAVEQAYNALAFPDQADVFGYVGSHGAGLVGLSAITRAGFIMGAVGGALAGAALVYFLVKKR